MAVEEALMDLTNVIVICYVGIGWVNYSIFNKDGGAIPGPSVAHYVERLFFVLLWPVQFAWWLTVRAHAAIWWLAERVMK